MKALAIALMLAQAESWREASGVLDRWCNDCHRPGQVGPFDFTTYEGASAYAPEISRYVLAQKMPPWRAKAGPVEWSNSRAIPDEQIASLLNWINRGAPRGQGAMLRKRHPQWNQGAPDLVISQPKEHTVSGETTVDIVSFDISPEELGSRTKRRYVQGIEFRPSNRLLLHHAVIKQSGRPWAAWCMTDTGVRLPNGVAWELERNQKLTIELHYFKRNLRPARDLTRIGIYFAKATPRRKAFLWEATKKDIRIPAGANLHLERSSFPVAETVQIHGILPVFQLLTQSIRLRPRGQRDWTLWIERYEHHLMSSYWLAKPLVLKKGSELELEAVYDNSTQNEFNPHKIPREVRFAENGLDETFRFWLSVSVPVGIP